MTALGLVEDVKRTMYRDGVEGRSEYPLDEKIGLLTINGNRSRYTQVFAWNAARLYAELTEEEAASTLHSLLGIEIDKAQVAKVGQAVAEKYDKTVDTCAANMHTGIENLEDAAEETECQPCENVAAVGFIAEKLKELDADPDRDKIIQATMEGNLDGAEGAKPAQVVVYYSSDGTGVPGLRRELSDKGKNGGKAGTFEAKIGCAFQQGFTANNKPVLTGGNIVRIPETTKYTGTTDKIGGFSPQFAEFALQNGMLSASQVVFLSDGATWLRKMQMRLCPTAISIVDFYHATEHLDDVIKILRFHNQSKRKEFADTCHKLLECGDIGQLISLIRGKANKSNKEKVDKKLAYFEHNVDRMRYGLFRAAGLFIGSGVIEAACKTIVGKRLKNAGMHWSKDNAKGVISLRCAICSNEFEVPRAKSLVG